MEAVVEEIRIAVATGASSEARARGAAACREVLVALEGERDLSPDPSPAVRAAGSVASDPIGGARALIAQLARIPAGHRLDLAIDVALAKLRSILPPDAPPVEIRVPRFPLVPLGASVPGSRR